MSPSKSCPVLIILFCAAYSYAIPSLRWNPGSHTVSTPHSSIIHLWITRDGISMCTLSTGTSSRSSASSSEYSVTSVYSSINASLVIDGSFATSRRLSPTTIKFLISRSFKYIFLKLARSLFTSSSITRSMCVIFLPNDSTRSRSRRLPIRIFWVLISLSLSNRENWTLPPPTSIIAVPFWIILLNSFSLEAMDL